MRVRLKTWIYKGMISCFVFAAPFAQAQTPANDPTWVLIGNLSDEFNGSAVDTSKWHVFDCTKDYFYQYWGGGTGFSAANTSVAGGYLQLKAENTVTQCNFSAGEVCGPGNQHYTTNQYKTGGMHSQTIGYSYGYLEMYAQLPGYVDGNGTAHGNKFWPAFWTYYDVENNGCKIYHDEIDIMDQCCDMYYDGRTVGSGASKWNGECGGAPVCFTTRTNPSPLCNSFHKYAVEWNRDKIVFYFDDQPYLENYSPFTALPMRLVVDLQIDADYGYNNNPVTGSVGECRSIDFDPNAFAPGNNPSMTLDYLRYYKLNLDCSKSAAILNNTDLANYFNILVPTFPGPPAVKSDITIGNGSSPVSLSPSDVRYFRAVNAITVTGDFTVPMGAELGLIPTGCN